MLELILHLAVLLFDCRLNFLVVCVTTLLVAKIICLRWKTNGMYGEFVELYINRKINVGARRTCSSAILI